MMKSKAAFVAVVVVLSSLGTVAYATGPVTRQGADYSGTRNPGNCEILVENVSQLHVKCTQRVGASGPAFVRYRFLKDVGGVREAASVSADIKTWVGEPCFAEWMVPQSKNPARTLRITIPKGSYCHINSVTWQQG